MSVITPPDVRLGNRGRNNSRLALAAQIVPLDAPRSVRKGWRQSAMRRASSPWPRCPSSCLGATSLAPALSICPPRNPLLLHSHRLPPWPQRQLSWRQVIFQQASILPVPSMPTMCKADRTVERLTGGSLKPNTSAVVAWRHPITHAARAQALADDAAVSMRAEQA